MRKKQTFFLHRKKGRRWFTYMGRNAHVPRGPFISIFSNYRSGHVVLTEEDLVRNQFWLVVVDVLHCDVDLHKGLQTYRRQVERTSCHNNLSAKWMDWMQLMLKLGALGKEGYGDEG